MAGSVDAAQVEEAWRALEALGYGNPSAEDIALTLHHAGQARSRGDGRPPHSGAQEDSLHRTSASPPRGMNDITMVPGVHDGEEAEAASGDGSPRPASASLKQWPGLSSHSIRGGRTTPMNSTGTGHHAMRGRRHGSRGAYGYAPQQQHHTAGVVVEDHRERQARRNGGAGGAHHLMRPDGSAREAVMPSTAGGARDGAERLRASRSAAEYVSPPARLERHLKRYERSLKALYVNRENGPGDTLWGESDFANDGADGEYDAEDSYERAHGEDDGDSPLRARFTGHPSHPALLEMPIRHSHTALDQRNANIIYSFTGDGRYKYRSGAGAPLSAVLGPNGSTLRQRADPVRRGNQMRELWKRDRFLAQQGRKEDRWRVRQSMLAWDL